MPARSVPEDTVPTKRILCLLLLCLLLPSLGRAQARSAPPPPVHIANPQESLPPADGDEARDQLSREMAKKANQERHAALKSDADKLLKMAVELKGYVDKSNENVLSLDVIKKAEEIEKLAHSVKDKMKGPN